MNHLFKIADLLYNQDTSSTKAVVALSEKIVNIMSTPIKKNALPVRAPAKRRRSAKHPQVRWSSEDLDRLMSQTGKATTRKELNKIVLRFAKDTARTKAAVMQRFLILAKEQGRDVSSLTYAKFTDKEADSLVNYLSCYSGNLIPKESLIELSNSMGKSIRAIKDKLRTLAKREGLEFNPEHGFSSPETSIIRKIYNENPGMDSDRLNALIQKALRRECSITELERHIIHLRYIGKILN